MFSVFTRRAEKGAELIRQEARLDRESIIEGAHAEAEEIVQRANLQARGILIRGIRDMKISVEQLKRGVREMNNEFLGATKSLVEACEKAEKTLVKANEQKKFLENKILELAEQAEKVAFSVEEKLGTLTVRDRKVRVGEKIFTFPVTFLVKIRGF